MIVVFFSNLGDAARLLRCSPRLFELRSTPAAVIGRSALFATVGRTGPTHCVSPIHDARADAPLLIE